MENDNGKDIARNLFLVALLFIITLFSARFEGYLHKVSFLFWMVLFIGACGLTWLSFRMSTKRLLALILGVFIIESMKESIGIASGLWVYHGRQGLFDFGVWSWVVGGSATCGVAAHALVPWIRKKNIAAPKWANPAIVVALFLLMWLTLGDYRPGVHRMFWTFYIVLFLVCLYFSRKMDFPLLAGIVVLSWIVGNPSELIGAVSAGIWTYPHNPHYPPFFLVFCCWPLEITTQYILSAYLANEPLDKGTY